MRSAVDPAAESPPSPLQRRCAICRSSFVTPIESHKRNVTLLGECRPENLVFTFCSSDILESCNQLADGNAPCRSLDCAICTPIVPTAAAAAVAVAAAAVASPLQISPTVSQPPSARASSLSSLSINEQLPDVAAEEATIEQLHTYFEAFLQLAPESARFAQQRGSGARTSERALVDAYFALIDECADERETILRHTILSTTAARNRVDDDDDDDDEAAAATADEVRRVRAHARRLERLFGYMLLATLRLRTLVNGAGRLDEQTKVTSRISCLQNSYAPYARQRIASYFSLRNTIEFVELAAADNGRTSPSTIRERQKARRLSTLLSQMNDGDNIFASAP